MGNVNLIHQNKMPNDIVSYCLANSFYLYYLCIMATSLKTHSWAAKRFKMTKNKKILFKKAGNNHLLTNKGKNHQKYPYGKVLSSTYAKKIKTLFPYT